MNWKKYVPLMVVVAVAVGGYVYLYRTPDAFKGVEDAMTDPITSLIPHPLSIETLRATEYPGSELKIEETLQGGSNYDGYRVSYVSEGNKIYSMLTIPRGNKPEKGWPVIVFNHGYIPPTQYRTTEKYVAYVDGFARRGYIVLKSDYRGHGSSEGLATGGYGSSAYTTDVLNAVASIRRHPEADPERIGMWGHSMGGYITLRSMVAEQNIKAGVIWAGVVGSYSDLLTNWSRRPAPSPSPGVQPSSRRWRQALLDVYGTPDSNPDFWNSISANAYLTDISGPVQIHHGTADSSVPILFSETLSEQLKNAGKPAEFYSYQGDDHNLSSNFGLAMTRSVEFFDKHL